MNQKVAIQIQHDSHWQRMLEIAADSGFRYISMGFGSSRCFHKEDWAEEIEKIRKSANKMIQQAQDKIKLIIAQTMQHEEQVADNSKQAPQARPEILNARKNLQKNAAQLSQAKPEINQSNSDFEKLAKMTDKNKMQDLPKSDEFQENKNSADKIQGKAQLELVDKNKDQQKQQQPNINAQDFINKQREIAQKDKMAHDNVKIRMQIFAMQFYNNQMRAA